MHNERNGAAGVRGNRAVNFLALVPHNGLRVSCETLGCHHLCSFHTCDLLARNANGSKKNDVLPLFVSVNVLLFSI